MHVCRATAARVAVIDKGAVVWRGDGAPFRADPDVQARHLQL